jgi:hypothetical protein
LCSRGPIERREGGGEDGAMLPVDRQPATPSQPGCPRDPVDELYARAWDVVAAAAELRAAARRRNTAAAVAATLGCVESALAHVAATSEVLSETSADRIRGDEAAREAQRAAHAFREAREAIGEAERACEAVRAAVGPLLGEPSAF